MLTIDLRVERSSSRAEGDRVYLFSFPVAPNYSSSGDDPRISLVEGLRQYQLNRDGTLVGQGARSSNQM